MDCEAVEAWTVMNEPSRMPPAILLAALRNGAMQLVVHEATLMMASPA